MGRSKNNSQTAVYRPKTRSEFNSLNRQLNSQGFIALDLLKHGGVKNISLGGTDPAEKGAKDMSAAMGCGAWSNGPLANVAWAFDEKDNTVEKVFDKDGKTELGLGYVKWGPNNSTPSVIPPLAQSSPYTAAPLAYIADLTTGLGPCLMYRFPDGTLSEFRDAGYKILLQLEKKKEEQEEDTVLPGISVGGGEQQAAKKTYIGDYIQTELGVMSCQDALKIRDQLSQEDKWLVDPQGVSTMPRSLGPDYWNKLYMEWERTWYGYDATDDLGTSHIPGAKEFLEENNLNLHMAQCEQDDVMLDIYFPTIGFSNKGRKGSWAPVINRVGFLPAHSTRLEMMDSNRFIHHCYFSDQWRMNRTKSARVVSPESMKVTMYQAAMPQTLLHELRYIVESNQKSAAYKRPMWVVCPTFFPSLNKPYYPQPAWWSVFTSKAFDFSATILYDKYKARENSTSWGKILYISLDWLDNIASDLGIAGDQDAIQKYVDELDEDVEQFLQRRENNGKMMRQWMWTDQKGDEHFNVKIVDVAETKNDEAKAGKEELELSTSPIFLALRVDPRLVGVPMVHSTNGGTALREMALLKQQQLNPKQKLYENFLNSVSRFNRWSERAEFHVRQMTFTTLDNSKTGTVETVSGEGA